MIKSLFAATAALSLASASALAGPYANVEANSGFTGSDYFGTVTDLHIGYEGDLGEDASYYAQIGPSFVTLDGEGTDTELGGKVGAGVDLTENINAYGEISFITGDENAYSTKVGVKYNF